MNPFSEWLTEVAGDSLFVDDTEGGLEREARNNLWSFSISQDQAQAVTAPDVTDFLEAVIECRRQQILRISGEGQPVTFYCWCEEQASQLRFSLVSTSHGRLPFALRLRHCRHLDSIVRCFLTPPRHAGIPLYDFAPEPHGTDPSAVGTASDTLQVWTKRLP